MIYFKKVDVMENHPEFLPGAKKQCLVVKYIVFLHQRLYLLQVTADVAAGVALEDVVAALPHDVAGPPVML